MIIEELLLHQMRCLDIYCIEKSATKTVALLLLEVPFASKIFS